MTEKSFSMKVGDYPSPSKHNLGQHLHRVWGKQWKHTGPNEVMSLYRRHERDTWRCTVVRRNDCASASGTWNITFGTLLDSIWRARNDVVFNGKSISFNSILVCAQDLAKSITNSVSLFRNLAPLLRIVTFLLWWVGLLHLRVSSSWVLMLRWTMMGLELVVEVWWEIKMAISCLGFLRSFNLARWWKLKCELSFMVSL